MSEFKKKKPEPELREFALSIKNAAPERVIAKKGLGERWKAARKKALAKGEGVIPLTEYLDCEAGSYVLAYILGVHDVTKGMLAAEKAQKQLRQMIDKGGVFVPRGTGVLDPRTLAEKMS